MTRGVTFEPVEGEINDRIDDAYRTKYRTSRYLAAMVAGSARAAIIRIEPHEGES